MAIRAICRIESDSTFFTTDGAAIQVDVHLEGFQGATLRTTLQADRTTITPANVLSGMKMLLIAAIQLHYGITLAASEILIFGAPQ